MPRRGISLIDAPSDLGLRPTGVTRLPDALRASGLLEGIADVRVEGAVEVPEYDSERDARTGVLNPDGIRTFSRRLAERVASVLDDDRFPVVLGGDCSILLGAGLALRTRGRFGLFFIDGHADYYSPEAEPSGEVASMELAIATAHGPPLLAELAGDAPLFREQDVVVFGCRDSDSAEEHGSPDVRQTAMRVFDLTDVRRVGPAPAAAQGLGRLEAMGLDGFWIHLDADVLHDDVMPAVDYRMKDGLWPEELTAVLEVLLASPLAVGIELTIYNPNLDDADLSAGRALADAVTTAFRATFVGPSAGS
jgi:arginase